MNKSKFLLALFLLCFCQFCFCNTTGEPVFTKKETLYSAKNGSPIGDLTLSIEAKSTNAKNNEWYLIIGDKSNNNIINSSDDSKTLWIFNKKTNANGFRRDLRNRDYPIEVRDISEFSPFCENGIRFDLQEWEEIRKQTQLSFYINASQGETVTLRLVFYTSSKDKKRTLIEDEARVRLEFVVPDLAALAKKNATEQQDGELISLTEKIDYEEVAKIKAERAAADSIKQLEEEDRGQRISLLNSFITERNFEIYSIQGEVDELLVDKKNKVESFKIDSFETVIDELKKKVDYWEKGYTDILLTDESIHDKFSKFSTAHSLTSRKLAELKQQQNPLSGAMKFAQDNWLLTIVIGIGGLIFLKIMYSLLSKLKSKVNGAIKKKVNNMKTKSKDKKQQKAMKKKEKSDTQKDFESIDISDLDQI